MLKVILFGTIRREQQNVHPAMLWKWNVKYMQVVAGESGTELFPDSLSLD